VFRISVADTGVGISSDDMDRIFEPFFRSGDREGYIEGPGLGLTVSKKYVEAMDGSLTVRSVRGQGSVFTAEVRLPADDIETVPDSEPFHRVCGEIDRCRLPEKRKHQMEPEWTDGDADGSPSTRKERRGWVTLPPTEILDRMRGFARRGALNDLESALKAAAASDPALGPFCDAAAGFVDRCDEEGLLMYIERLENKENGR
jgi:hypothetical protein